MLYRPLINRRKKLLIRLLATIIILLIFTFCLFEFKARDLVHNTVDNELEIHAANAIDDAVSQVLDKSDVEYSEIVVVKTAQDGSISSLETDSKEINLLKSRISHAITENIKCHTKVEVGVPAGAFTGLVLLSSIGPDIKMYLTVDGSAVTNIKSEFESAGINQTVHRIYLVVDADVSLTCPIISYETNVVSEFELCQTVIVGSTPQFYAAS